MKKIISFILATIMVLSLFACGEQTDPTGQNQTATGDPALNKPERVLEVGYSRKDITPEGPIMMDDGMSTGKEGKLELITIAFRDEEGEMYYHITTDLSWGGMSDNGPENSYGVCDMLRVAAKKNLGIDPAFITVAGTHNHNQLAYGSKDQTAEDWRNNILIPYAMASIQEATADLSPAEMFIGRTETVNLTFVRRYFLQDGSLYEGFTGNRDSEIVKHETDADEEIQLVKFVREGKKDILMINWQTHADSAGDKGTILNPDFPGPLRDQVEADLGVLPVFSQGACGNLASFSRIDSENVVNAKGWAKAVKLGKAVAAYVVDLYESEDFTQVKTGLIQNKRITVTGTSSYHYDADEIERAKKVQAFHKTHKNGNYYTAAYAQTLGIETIYHANAIITNSKLGPTKDYELNIISIGDVAFTTLPMEFFDTTGMQIKNGSPFEMTFLFGYSCSKGQYVPDKEAWEHGGYESYKSYFAKGTAEEAVSYYLKTLNEQFPTRFG